MADGVTLTRQGAVAVLTIERPEALNALNRAVVAAFERTLDAVEADAGVAALVVTGAGRAFVAGADIAEMRTMTPLEAEAFSGTAHRVFGRLESLRIPTIAAVNGFALGGGCELALCCDWIYASSKAKLGQPETKLGLIPGFGGTSRLVRRVGLAWAKELVLVADPIDAALAARIGLVNRVWPQQDLLARTLDYAQMLAERAPLAHRFAKQTMRRLVGMNLQQQLEAEVRSFHDLGSSQDLKEGTAAFAERRPASFKGR